MLAASLATVLFSLSVVFANRTVRALGSVRANLCRLVLATLFLALWAWGPGQGFSGGAFGWFFLSGCLGFGLGDLALYASLPRVGPRLAGLLIQCLAAPFAALVEWIWLGTTLEPGQWLAGAVILTGVGIAVAPREHLHVARRVLWMGVALGVLAAVGQGSGAVLSRKAYQVVAASGGHVDGLTAAFQRILGGLLFAGPWSVWWLYRQRAVEGTPGPAGRGRSRWVGLWVLLNALAGPTVGVGCYQWALATAPSGVVLPIVATMPVVVIPFAWALEGDRPGIRSVLGGLVAVAGAVALTLL